MNKLVTGILTAVVVLTSACHSDDEICTCLPPCEETVIVDADLYKNAPSDFLTITDASIHNDCLYVRFSASGCDGDSWEIKLIDANVIKESNPIQRDIRLSLKNEEECLAVFTRTLTFDLTPVRTDDNEILLNLSGWDEQLLYRY